MEHGDDGVDSEASEGDSLNTDEELLTASLGLVLGRFVRSAHDDIFFLLLFLKRSRVDEDDII